MTTTNSTPSPYKVPSIWSNVVSEVLLTPEQIATRNTELGHHLTQIYHNKNPILLAVLKGSIIFLSDLSRQIHTPHELHFITASSYNGTSSSGHVKLSGLDRINLKDRHVLLIEDIVDTGLTLKSIVEQLKMEGPASLKICTFLLKETDKRLKQTPEVDFVAHRVEDRFVVGYGLDVDQKYRHLPFLGIYKKGA